ncbi:MAG: hypothetical protein DDT31_01978 [Syntrophomonadaceae bacterium]|nr:hypothetical protein [Bacillota bacterium]
MKMKNGVKKTFDWIVENHDKIDQDASFQGVKK